MVSRKKVPHQAESFSVKFPALLLLIFVLFHWKLVLSQQFDWVWGPDLAQQVLPWLEEQSRQAHQGQLPLWDPHTWAGQPFVGQAQPGTAYPLNWILFALPRRDGHISMLALQWYFVLIHYMGALFCYLLCRDLGRSRTTSLLAGLIFSLSGYFASVGWPQMVNGAIWAPLVFLFLFRTARGARPWASAALCGLSLGLAWLSGHHQAPTFLTVCCGGVWVFYFLRTGRPEWRMAKVGALALAVCGLVGALQILPGAEYAYLARRWAGGPQALAWNQPVPYSVHALYSLSPLNLFGILFPSLRGHVDPFVGVGAFSLALLAAAACWRERAVRFFTALGLAAILFSLGQYDVFHGMLYALVPLLEKARTPAAAVFIFSCAAAVLAAFALDDLAAAPHSAWVRRLARALLVFGVAACALFFAVELIQKMAVGFEPRLAMPALAALLLAALLYGWRAGGISQRQFLALAGGVLLLELGTDSGFVLSDRGDPGRRVFLEKTTGNADIAAFLAQQPGPFRIDTEGDDLATDWGEYHNFGVLKAFTPSVTNNLIGLEFHLLPTRRLYNVRYTVGRKPPADDFKPVFQAASGLKVYEDPGAFPRAWTVHELVRVSSGDQARWYINNDLDSLRRKALISTPPPQLETCAVPDRIEIASYRAESIHLRAQMSCRGLLVLSDTMYPGWKAAVDGVRVPIYQVNFGMRAVVVPPGDHRVSFSFRPLTVYLGAALTCLGVLFALAIARRFNHDDTPTPEAAQR